jgi:hypothetical protein
MNINNQPGSTPLTDDKLEAFVIALSKGQSQRSAYKEFVSQNCTNKTAEQVSSRIVHRSPVKERLAFIKVQSKHLTGRLLRDDLRNVLQVIARTGNDISKIAAVKQLKDYDDEDKRVQAAQANLDPAVIVQHIARYPHRPPGEDHIRACVERLASLLCVPLARLATACMDRADAPPSEPTVDNSLQSNTLQQVDNNNPSII